MGKKYWYAFIILLFSFISQLAAQKKIDHMIWDQLLLLNVSSEGEINYKGFIRDKFLFDNYFENLATNYPDEKSSKSEQLAYWTNLYNASILKMIIDQYPISSINELKNPWKRNVIKIDNQKYSLEDIENEKIRKMKDPRVHFLLNRSTKSSPKLWNRAYTSRNINAALHSRTKAYINDSDKNILTKNRIIVSQIFEWYKDDFKEGDILPFIKQYSDVEISRKPKINYTPYNWELNRKDTQYVSD